jgi:hypothetical protein
MTQQNLPTAKPAEQLVDGIKAMTEEQLFRYVEGLLVKTTADYQKMAEAIKELDDRGADLSRLKRNPLLPLLRKVGHKQLAMQALVELPYPVLKIVERMPMPLQVQIANPDSRFVLIALREDGQVYEWSKPARDMTRNEAQLVFAQDHIRTKEEMISILRTASPMRQNAAMSDRPILAIDRRRGGLTVRVGKETVFMQESELLSNLARLHQSD